MYSWLSPKLELRSDGISGSGIFCTNPINKDERLIVFGGKVMTLEEEVALPEEIRDYAHQIDDDLVIGIIKKEDIQAVDQVNHSCNPNAGFKGQIFLMAMRDIMPNEEITFDYAMVLGSASNTSTYSLACLCELPECRKEITDMDWQKPELQERYKGYFQYYLEEKIRKSTLL